MEATGIRVIEYADKNAELEIWDIADIHRDNVGCDADRFYEDISELKSKPFALWFCGGDYGDFIRPGDKRFNPEIFPYNFPVRQLANMAAHVSDMIINDFSPIKDKCLGFCYGNHDHNYLIQNQQLNIHGTICDKLGVPNMRYSGWADLYFKYNPKVKEVKLTITNSIPSSYTSRLRCVVHHGFSASGTAGGKINALQRLVNNVEADLVMMGHVHEQIAKSFTRLTVNENCTHIKSKITMGMITGSYLRTYIPDVTSYGEIRGYSPTTLGASKARYIPSKKRLIVENVADGIG